MGCGAAVPTLSPYTAAALRGIRRERKEKRGRKPSLARESIVTPCTGLHGGKREEGEKGWCGKKEKKRGRERTRADARITLLFLDGPRRCP